MRTLLMNLSAKGKELKSSSGSAIASRKIVGAACVGSFLVSVVELKARSLR